MHNNYFQMVISEEKIHFENKLNVASKENNHVIKTLAWLPICYLTGVSSLLKMFGTCYQIVFVHIRFLESNKSTVENILFSQEINLCLICL